jgi:ABC-type multidrug transport system fused ATPase/permease subunit
MKSKAASLPLTYRLAVTSRCLAALLGGYLLAAMVGVLLSQWLPLPKAEAVQIGMMSSFLFYLGAFIWAFATHSAWRAWLGILVPGGVLAAINGLTYWMAIP